MRHSVRVYAKVVLAVGVLGVIRHEYLTRLLWTARMAVYATNYIVKLMGERSG